MRKHVKNLHIFCLMQSMLNNTRPLPFRRTPRSRDRAPATPVPAHFAPHLVTLSSSSHAYAVSILPFGKTLDLQGGSSSFPKISLRCDFREPYYHSPPSGVILRVCVSEDKRLPFLAFPLFKGEGGPLAVDEGCNILISLSPLPSLRDTFPRGGRQDLCYSKQILKKRQNHAFASFLFYKQFCASESRAFR